MPSSSTIRHFSIALPKETDRSDVPALLRHLAANLEERGPIEVQDITFGTEVTAEGLVHDFTVYFHDREAEKETAGEDQG